MRNIKLTLAFDGTSYAGWQRQKNQPTIQGTLESKISLMTCRPVTLHGSGRTDAGVHALAMVANFHTESTIPCSGFLKGLNSLLPQDIRILAVVETSVDFHARFKALGKTYIYQVYCGPIIPPHLRLYCTHLPGKLDLKSMETCLQSVVGEHDFSSFEAAGSRDHTTSQARGAIRKISAAHIDQRISVGATFCIAISGNGFLRHMVRNIAGTLFAVGKGHLNVRQFTEILAVRDRSAAGTTAPPQGLFLKEVFY